MERAALKEDWTVARLCAKERALRRLEIENIDWTTTAAVALHTGPPPPQVPHSIPTSIRSGSYSCTSVAIMNTKIEHLAHRRVSASVESRFTKEGRALSL